MEKFYFEFRDLKRAQEIFAEWLNNNFKTTANDPGSQFEGIVEEVGELARARLKSRQRIREFAANGSSYEAEMDAIGDILIYLISYCNARGFSIASIFNKTAQNVLKRDWNKYPRTGGWANGKS